MSAEGRIVPAPTGQCEALSYLSGATDQDAVTLGHAPDAVARCTRAVHPEEQEHYAIMPIVRGGMPGTVTLRWRRQ